MRALNSFHHHRAQLHLHLLLLLLLHRRCRTAVRRLMGGWRQRGGGVQREKTISQGAKRKGSGADARRQPGHVAGGRVCVGGSVYVRGGATRAAGASRAVR